MIDLNAKRELITKELLLKHVSDTDVYQRYLVGREFKVGATILSPLRDETTPSFGFFKGTSGEICFKDHLLGAGDCIRFVQMKFGLTFFEALSKIAVDFELDSKYICKSVAKTPVVNDTPVKFKTRDQILSNVMTLKLGKTRRRWEEHDFNYWRQFGISLKTLEHFRVEPIAYFHINDRIYAADKYAYCFIELKEGIETYKFYQPFNEKYKWINGHNDSVWQGWDKLPQIGPDLILTKSLKDVMSIYEVCGLPAVSLQSENVTPKKHVFKELEERFKYLYLLYDNDFDKEINWGQKFAGELTKELGNLTNIVIDEKYKSKDFSDLVMNTSPDDAKKFLITELEAVPF